MNQERAMLLVDALRSGEFEQGTQRLVSIKGGKQFHCCLGVASVIAERAGVCESSMSIWTEGLEFQRVLQDADDNHSRYKESIMLPDSVQEWFGFATEGGQLKPDAPIEGRPLYIMNDGDWDDDESDEWNLQNGSIKGMTFLEIADHIEKNWMWL
jgi:hypothetical protein